MKTGGHVLGIDTSTFWLNLAVVDGGGAVRAERHEFVRTHTTRLVPALDALLQEAGADRARLLALGVVVGPGSFTGLRVGLAAAQALSQALSVPAFGMDTLTALALCSSGEGEGLALLDARRRQVYAARFLRRGGKVERLGEIRSVPPEEVLAPAQEAPSWAIGDGVALVSGLPEACALEPEVPNLALPAAIHALECLERGASGEKLAPLYVRPPDIRRSGA